MRKDPAEAYESLPSLAPEVPGAPRGSSAGAMLKAAREKQGLHIAVLAATIKVSTAKLEALEQDRYAELPNATFVRALAQSVCRSLKVDPRPVLAMLPHADSVPLEPTVGRLNAPFEERNSRDGTAFALTSKPLFWAGGVLLAAAVAVYWLPAAWLERGASVVSSSPPPGTTVAEIKPVPAPAAVPAAPSPAAGEGAASAAAASSSAAAAPAAPTPPLASPPVPPAPVAAATPQAAAAPPTPVVEPGPAAAPVPVPPAPVAALKPGIVQLTTTAASWVEVQDGGARILLSRLLQPGESVGVDGALPLRMKIGNASGTQLTFRGQTIDLAPLARDNVARVELK